MRIDGSAVADEPVNLRISAATRPAPGSVNDDGFVVGPSFAVVLDGCTDPGRPSGCVHDVPWLVARLSGHLTQRLTVAGDAPLTEVVARAIERTGDEHRTECDLSHPDSPSSTVTAVRVVGNRLDYLLLADSPLVVTRRDGGTEALVDRRPERLSGRSFDEVAVRRNTPDGFWVAAARPEAAYRAVTGSIPVSELSSVLLLTDGASRLVDRHGHDWAELVTIAEHDGPDELLARVHRADSAAAAAGTARRGKSHDDATAVLCRFDDR